MRAQQDLSAKKNLEERGVCYIKKKNLRWQPSGLGCERNQVYRHCTLRRACRLFLDASSSGVSICTLVPVKQEVNMVPGRDTRRIHPSPAMWVRSVSMCTFVLSFLSLYFCTSKASKLSTSTQSKPPSRHLFASTSVRLCLDHRYEKICGACVTLLYSALLCFTLPLLCQSDCA